MADVRIYTEHPTANDKQRVTRNKETRGPKLYENLSSLWAELDSAGVSPAQVTISDSKSCGQDGGATKVGAAGDAHTGKKVEGRAVIGDGAPFAAQHNGLGVQGWSQSAALNKRKKYLRQIKHNYEEEVARGDAAAGRRAAQTLPRFQSRCLIS